MIKEVLVNTMVMKSRQKLKWSKWRDNIFYELKNIKEIITITIIVKLKEKISVSF